MNKEEFEKHKPFAGEKKPSMLRRRVGHDYESRRMYLITMTVEDRRPLLGRLVGRSDAKVGSPDYPHGEMLKSFLLMKKFIVLFGLCYKLIYLCSAIRMKCAKSDLAAGGWRRCE